MIVITNGLLARLLLNINKLRLTSKERVELVTLVEEVQKLINELSKK